MDSYYMGKMSPSRHNYQSTRIKRNSQGRYFYQDKRGRNDSRGRGYFRRYYRNKTRGPRDFQETSGVHQEMIRDKR